MLLGCYCSWLSQYTEQRGCVCDNYISLSIYIENHKFTLIPSILTQITRFILIFSIFHICNCSCHQRENWLTLFLIYLLDSVKPCMELLFHSRTPPTSTSLCLALACPLGFSHLSCGYPLHCIWALTPRVGPPTPIPHMDTLLVLFQL